MNTDTLDIATIEAAIIAGFSSPHGISQAEKIAQADAFRSAQLEADAAGRTRDIEQIAADRAAATQIRDVVVPQREANRAAVHAELPALADAYQMGLARCAQSDALVNEAQADADAKDASANQREKKLGVTLSPKTVADVLIAHVLRNTEKSNDPSRTRFGCYGIVGLTENVADPLERIERMYPESRPAIVEALRRVGSGVSLFNEGASDQELAAMRRQIERTGTTQPSLSGIGGAVSGRSQTSVDNGMKSPQPHDSAGVALNQGLK